ncbi:effector-associated constant component EACC1 [Nonomuraea jabiensis]|uniref:effector-associated constant component EACC1 n=1 Tax=Nonomuraea jabiensis TaxID=882448 RepID=UPI003D72B4D1
MAQRPDGGDGGALLVADGPDEVRDLYAWLRREPELRAALRLVEKPPPDGALGPVAEAVQVLADAPEVVAAVASMVIAWLRYRRTDVKITVKQRKDGPEVQVTATGLRALSPEQTLALARQIESALRDDRKPPELPGG